MSDDTMRLVPVEPTREMWAAAGTAACQTAHQHHDKIVEAVWSAMLSAAPTPSTRDEVGPVAGEGVRWTEDMEYERRAADYERGFMDGKEAVAAGHPVRWGLKDEKGQILALTYVSKDEALRMGGRCPTVLLAPLPLYAAPPAPQDDALRIAVERAAEAVVLGAWTDRHRRLHDHPLVTDLERALAALKSTAEHEDGVPTPKTYTCTSGRGDSCTCFACHGG